MKRFLEKLKRKDLVTLVAFGDSNTELTWHTAGRLNWVGLLQYALFEKHGTNVARIINASQCGSSAVSSLPRLEREVLSYKPDLVIVSFGMNDAGAGEEGLDAFSTAIRQIVRQLRQTGNCEVLLGTSNPVVVCHQPKIPAGATPGGEWPALHQHLYAKRTVELAAELDCAVVDHYILWTQAENRDENLSQPTNHLWNRMSDAFHPGALGHLHFYQELAPLFELPPDFPWAR